MNRDVIINKAFTRAFLGYDAGEVDAFLDEIIREFDRIKQELDVARLRNKMLLEELERFRVSTAEQRREQAENAANAQAAPEQEQTAAPQAETAEPEAQPAEAAERETEAAEQESEAEAGNETESAEPAETEPEGECEAGEGTPRGEAAECNADEEKAESESANANPAAT